MRAAYADALDLAGPFLFHDAGEGDLALIGRPGGIGVEAAAPARRQAPCVSAFHVDDREVSAPAQRDLGAVGRPGKARAPAQAAGAVNSPAGGEAALASAVEADHIQGQITRTV